MKLTVRDVLMARMSNVKSSVRAIRYIQGSWQERLKAYRQLLEENEDYILHGLSQRADDESDEEMPF